MTTNRRKHRLMRVIPVLPVAALLALSTGPSLAQHWRHRHLHLGAGYLGLRPGRKRVGLETRRKGPFQEHAPGRATRSHKGERFWQL